MDEKIRALLDLATKKKEYCIKDKDESLRIINKHFEGLQKRLEERKNSLF
jgi:hypothetical protein